MEDGWKVIHVPKKLSPVMRFTSEIHVRDSIQLVYFTCKGLHKNSGEETQNMAKVAYQR